MKVALTIVLAPFVLGFIALVYYAAQAVGWPLVALALGAIVWYIAAQYIWIKTGG